MTNFDIDNAKIGDEIEVSFAGFDKSYGKITKIIREEHMDTVVLAMKNGGKYTIEEKF